MGRRITEDEVRRRLEGRDDVELVEYAGTLMSKSRFRCPEGHEWNATTANVVKGVGCGICAGNVALTEDDAHRRLVGRDVELIEYAGTASARSLFCCPSGHQWRARAAEVFRGRGCPKCTKFGPSTEAEVRYKLADRADLEMVEYAGTVVGMSLFRCREGHEWRTRAAGVYQVGNGCPRCAKNARVDEVEARRRLEGRGIELVEYAGTVAAKSLFRCPNGHEWRSVISHVVGGTGCPKCAGVSPVTEAEARRRLEDRDDVELLLRHDEFLALKIGVTNKPESRIEQHNRRGWQTVRLWPAFGAIAHEVEQAIIRGWRDAGLPPAVTDIIDGYTETVSMMSVEVDDVVLEVERLMRERGTCASPGST